MGTRMTQIGQIFADFYQSINCYSIFYVIFKFKKKSVKIRPICIIRVPVHHSPTPAK